MAAEGRDDAATPLPVRGNAAKKIMRSPCHRRAAHRTYAM
jgi:hypothetical protein